MMLRRVSQTLPRNVGRIAQQFSKLANARNVASIARGTSNNNTIATPAGQQQDLRTIIARSYVTNRLAFKDFVDSKKNIDFSQPTIGPFLSRIDVTAPDHFDRFAANVKTTIDDLVEQATSAEGANALQVLNNIREEFEAAMNTLNLYISLHPDVRLTTAAQATIALLEQYRSLSLLEKSELYSKLSSVLASNLSAEQKATAQVVKNFFESTGLALPADKRDNFRDSVRQFVQAHDNLNAIFQEDRIFQLERPSRLNEIPRRDYNEMAKEKKKKKKFINIPVARYADSVLTHQSHRDIRQGVYEEAQKLADDLFDQLPAVEAAATKLANSLGYDSYADYVLANNSIVGTPQGALDKLSDIIEQFAAKSLAELETFRTIRRFNYEERKQILKQPKEDKDKKIEGDLSVIAPFDVAFLKKMTRVYKEKYSEEQTQAYFPIDACLEALEHLSSTLLGVSLKPAKFAPGEPWEPKDARKLNVVDEQTNNVLGVLYFDLFIHDGKKMPSVNLFNINQPQKPPASAVIFDFNEHFIARPSTLTHDNFRALLREAGSALFQILSPSSKATSASAFAIQQRAFGHIFEKFAFDSSFIRRFCTHFATNKAIPADIVKQLTSIERRSGFAATDAVTDIAYSITDTYLASKKYRGNIRELLEGNIKRVAPAPVYVDPRKVKELGTLNATIGFYAKAYASHAWKKIFNNAPVPTSSIPDAIVYDLLTKQDGANKAKLRQKLAAAATDPLALLDGEQLDFQHFVREATAQQ